MTSIRIYLTVSAIVVSCASANFRNGPIPTGDSTSENPVSWMFSSSDLANHYAQFLTPSDNLKHGTHPIPAIDNSESSLSLSKRIPKENKNFKKATKEDLKHQKSESPQCHEIKTQEKDAGRDVTCYKCKDPKNGSTYETCSYGSLPEASSGFESYLDVPSPFRARRSDAGKKPFFGKSHESLTRRSDGDSPYHFSEDYFLPEATRELPAEYKTNTENCDRVEKDSMICMVCKDPTTNGKYEQCSYVAQPKGKAYAYTKSSSFNEPSTTKPRRAEARRPPKVHRSDEDDEDDEEAETTEHIQDRKGYRPRYQEYSRYSSYEDSDEDEEPKESSSRASKSNEDCKTIEKDTMTCTVCRDSKTGRKSEVCSYESRPKDKHYRYTKSKSFGNPAPKVREDEEDDDSSEQAESSDRSEKSSEDDEESYRPSRYSYEPSKQRRKEKKKNYHDANVGDFIKSESEKISEKIRSNTNDCEKVEKDSMICTVCKDQKTGGNSEQCSYSYEPRSKVFAYSTSKSFGNPTKTAESDEDESDEESPAESSISPIYFSGPKYDLIGKPSGLKYNKDESQRQESRKRPRSKPKAESTVDANFYDASERKAEIEKFMAKFQAEDWSNCTRAKKGEMTCYRCKDEHGVENEECIFLAEPDTSSQVEAEVSKEKVPVPSAVNSTAVETEVTTSTKIPYVRSKREKKDEDTTDQYEKVPVLDEELYEAEPYEYVSETRPVYDKILGMTLPRYMLEVTDQEKEFDEVVAKSRFD